MTHENESLFLAFRRFFPVPSKPFRWVEDESEIIQVLEENIGTATGRVGILLSSGVDSAILARFVPAGSIAYTLDYEGGNYQQYSEYAGASKFVPSGVEHKRIIIGRQEYFRAIDELTEGRKAPTVPHEAAVYLAGQAAKDDGVEFLIGGFGADGRLGGFPALHRNRRPIDFRQQMFKSYIEPSRVLIDAAPVDWVFEKYTVNGEVDVQRFLTEVGTEGSSAREAIALAGLVPLTPYTELAYAGRFDLSREPKYLLNNVFSTLYGYAPPSSKFALWVPYHDWFGGIRIQRPEFHPGCAIAKPLFAGEPKSFVGRVARRAWSKLMQSTNARRFSAKQGYLLYSLERYFHFKERHGWITPDPHQDDVIATNNSDH